LKYGKMTKNALATVLRSAGAKPIYDPSFPISTKPKIINASAELNESGNISEDPMTNNGKISTKTYDQIKSLSRGNNVTIYIRAKGADGISHNISKVVTIR